LTAPLDRVGPLRLSTPAESVRAFRRETGWRDADGPPPASYPVVFMRMPEIGEPIRRAAQEIGLPVHEAQHFEYARPVEIDAEYDVTMELRRESDPPRLVSIAEVFDLSGAFVARITTTLRLIDPAMVARLAAEGSP
jgi:hypothetical protein